MRVRYLFPRGWMRISWVEVVACMGEWRTSGLKSTSRTGSSSSWGCPWGKLMVSSPSWTLVLYPSLPHDQCKRCSLKLVTVLTGHGFVAWQKKSQFQNPDRDQMPDQNGYPFSKRLLGALFAAQGSFGGTSVSALLGSVLFCSALSWKG